ncbi:MAG: hypothetical protein CMC73_04770 [Flavobacteriaceae bacterium]|jgi:hypothetical protein|nr:hypothetical protein [Flavobacteriaceae bacterium]|tara:strand:- start:361 stop:591 length:231 start_codon:yes stop_codon:yes gene_type:complete
MKESLNTIPLEKFIQQVKSADASNQKEIRLDIQTAKKVAFTLAEVMTRLNGDLEELLIKDKNAEEVISIVMQGENF